MVCTTWTVWWSLSISLSESYWWRWCAKMLQLKYPCAGYGCWWRGREEVKEKKLFSRTCQNRTALRPCCVPKFGVLQELCWLLGQLVGRDHSRRAVRAAFFLCSFAGAGGGKRLRPLSSARRVLLPPSGRAVPTFAG
ncbi:hypothetical protein NDU88_010101 [Pleurodeles waltl]|uniref:Secreted protein n=1 Tax=Pleurodeles waltl TaxID=8319 RepID=A0AAV7QWE2_PLEWA|nr:hypothetical protein NDU88_010101 [Pleurodeles waltl]